MAARESMGYGDAAMGYGTVAQASTNERATFIKRAYMHLLGAMIGFVLLEVWYFESGLAEKIFTVFAGNWFLMLGGWMLVSWLASRVAHTARSLGAQYAALSAFVVGESLVFAPLLFLAYKQNPAIIENAAHVTLAGFVGLTAIAFITRKDFSFLRGLLYWGGLCALGVILVTMFTGMSGGFHVYFCVAMVGLAGGGILYDTSNIIHHYSTDRYVAAALELFSSVALMLWYVIRLFMSRD